MRLEGGFLADEGHVHQSLVHQQAFEGAQNLARMVVPPKTVFGRAHGRLVLHDLRTEIWMVVLVMGTGGFKVGPGGERPSERSLKKSKYSQGSLLRI